MVHARRRAAGLDLPDHGRATRITDKRQRDSVLYIVPQPSTDRGSGMATPSIRHLVIRLLPTATRVPTIPGIAASLTIHGALVAFALQAGGHGQRMWLPPAPAPSTTLAPTPRFVALIPHVRQPETARHSLPTDGRANPMRRSSRYLAPESLDGATRPMLAVQRIPQSELRAAIVGEATALAPHTGVSTSAELRGKAGDACPELRRPRGGSDARDALAVAVTFVVDAAGIIDQSTMKVVQAPGMPALRTGFVPHIYAVSATARIDRRLPHAAGAYGPIVVDDVVRHVAQLRFHPGSRNGRPAQSVVLISCRVS